jgi:hypothetical protein
MALTAASIEFVVLSILNALIAALFGWYTSYSFPKQSHTRDPELIASFFRLSDYVKTASLDSYRKAFCVLISFIVFCPLEVLAISPEITKAAHVYLLKKLTDLIGTENAGTITNIDNVVSPAVLPFVTGIAALCLLFPHVKFCLSKARDAIHRMVDFKGNAQRLINEVHEELETHAQLSQQDIERVLEENFEDRIAPRPRELAKDEQRLAKYQLLYYATFRAPAVGLDSALNDILKVFGRTREVRSRIQFFDFNKVTIGIVVYLIFVYLYVAYIPHCWFVSTYLYPDHVSLPVTWPNDKGGSLTIEIISLSLQISATLMYGLAFYELTYLDESNAGARRRRLGRTLVAQFIVGVVVGLAFHLITIWRVESGDAPDPARPYVYLDPGLLGLAVAPSVIAPILLCVWACFSRVRLPKAILIFAMALLGGALLGFIQFTYEFNHPPAVAGEYYLHESFLGFCLVLICMIIRILVGMLGDLNAPPVRNPSAAAKAM